MTAPESYVNQLINKMRSSIEVHDIQLIDDSESHAGHAGHRPGGNTHFRLRIVSEAFAGLSQIGRHRLIYNLLKEELAQQIHALNITALTPDEAARRGADGR